MKYKFQTLFTLIIIYLPILQCKHHLKEPSQMSFPQKVVIDNYFDQIIQDPFRNMEDDNDSLVLEWYRSHTNFSNKTIKNIAGKEILLKRITEDSKKSGDEISNVKITNNNNKLFYLRRSANEINAKLYFSNDLFDQEILLYDPKNFNSKSGYAYIINYIQPSIDGSLVLVSLSKHDEEISKMIVINVSSKKVYPQIISNCWPSALAGVSWLSDNSGFTYSHIPDITSNSENYLLNTSSVLYMIGQNPEKLDILLSKKNNPLIKILPEEFPMVLTKGSDKYLFGRIAGARNYDDYYYTEKFNENKDKINWKTLYKKEDKIKTFVIDNDNIIFLSSKDSPNYKICKTLLPNPDFGNPIVLVKEDKKAIITDFCITKNGIYYVKTKNGVDADLYHLTSEGNEINIKIPKKAGQINLHSTNNLLWIEIEGWTNRLERYIYDFDQAIFTKMFNQKTVKDELNSFDNVVIKEIEISSHDGVKVPLSIIHSNKLKLNGKNRLLMTGYGAYGISDTPYFDKYLKYWVSQGGVYAIAHVRGGGEKGDIWHKGGYKITKPNTWKDFISCTEYFIKKGYTSPDKIAVWSGSAGGILIGRAITERPDLYSAAIIKAGVLNAIRTETGPNGPNNMEEFGTVKDSTEFKSLFEMDAYHHIKSGEKYPAVYITAGLKDARGSVWESGKFVAKLLMSSSSDKPILFSVDEEGGHGFDATQNKRNKEVADFISFALWQTGHPDYQLKN